MLLEVAGEILAEDQEVFSPVLAQYFPDALPTAACRLHLSVGAELREWLRSGTRSTSAPRPALLFTFLSTESDCASLLLACPLLSFSMHSCDCTQARLCTGWVSICGSEGGSQCACQIPSTMLQRVRPLDTGIISAFRLQTALERGYYPIGWRADCWASNLQCCPALLYDAQHHTLLVMLNIWLCCQGRAAQCFRFCHDVWASELYVPCH